jgi:hypothetical protein
MVGERGPPVDTALLLLLAGEANRMRSRGVKAAGLPTGVPWASASASLQMCMWAKLAALLFIHAYMQLFSSQLVALFYTGNRTTCMFGEGSGESAWRVSGVTHCISNMQGSWLQRGNPGRL